MTKMKKKVIKKKAPVKKKKRAEPEVETEHDDPAPQGHNTPPEEPEEPETKTTDGIAGKQLLQFINQVERLESERKEIGDDIKDIYAHAKSTGFDPKIIRKVVAMRKRDKADVEEEQSLIDTYRMAIGDL